MCAPYRRPTWTLLLFASAVALMPAGPAWGRPSMSAAGMDQPPAVVRIVPPPALVEAPALLPDAVPRSRGDGGPEGTADPDRPTFPRETPWAPEGRPGTIPEGDVPSRRVRITEMRVGPRLPGERGGDPAAIARVVRALGYRWAGS